MWLLVRTASRTWARCCNARAVRTASRTWTGCPFAGVSWSKLVLAAWSHRVERAWWLRLNCVLVLRTKWTDWETVAKVCQALVHMKSSEQIDEAWVFSCPWLCRSIGNGSYGFTVPKLCGRIGDGSYGFSLPKLCGCIESAAMALPSQRCADASETVAKALSCQSCADVLSW